MRQEIPVSSLVEQRVQNPTTFQSIRRTTKEKGKTVGIAATGVILALPAGIAASSATTTVGGILGDYFGHKLISENLIPTVSKVAFGANLVTDLRGYDQNKRSLEKTGTCTNGWQAAGSTIVKLFAPEAKSKQAIGGYTAVLLAKALTNSLLLHKFGGASFIGMSLANAVGGNVWIHYMEKVINSKAMENGMEGFLKNKFSYMKIEKILEQSLTPVQGVVFYRAQTQFI